MSRPDPLFIDPPEGMAYKWVVTHVTGRAVMDGRPLSMDPVVVAMDAGWRLVPMDRYYPEFAFPHGPGGAVLMERPKAEADAAMAELTRHANKLQEIAVEEVVAEFKANLPKGFRLVEFNYQSTSGNEE